MGFQDEDRDEELRFLGFESVFVVLVMIPKVTWKFVVFDCFDDFDCLLDYLRASKMSY